MRVMLLPSQRKENPAQRGGSLPKAIPRGVGKQHSPSLLWRSSTPSPRGPQIPRKSRPPHHHLLLPNRLLPPQGFCAPLLILLPKQKGVLTFSCFWTFAYAILSAWNISSLPPFSR